MTANHEYAPTMYDIRDQFIEAWAGDFVNGKVDAAKYFDRALNAHNECVEAAAELRGKIEGLRDAANLSRTCWAANKNLIDPDNPEASYSFDRWLEVRADLLEGDVD